MKRILLLIVMLTVCLMVYNGLYGLNGRDGQQNQMNLVNLPDESGVPVLYAQNDVSKADEAFVTKNDGLQADLQVEQNNPLKTIPPATDALVVILIGFVSTVLGLIIKKVKAEDWKRMMLALWSLIKDVDNTFSGDNALSKQAAANPESLNQIKKEYVVKQIPQRLGPVMTEKLIKKHGGLPQAVEAAFLLFKDVGVSVLSKTLLTRIKGLVK